jgi:hypothetical protein
VQTNSQAVKVHRGKGCEDCGELHPRRGFYPIFEDDDEGTHKICWPCYDRRVAEELLKERVGTR